MKKDSFNSENPDPGTAAVEFNRSHRDAHSYHSLSSDILTNEVRKHGLF